MRLVDAIKKTKYVSETMCDEESVMMKHREEEEAMKKQHREEKQMMKAQHDEEKNMMEELKEDLECVIHCCDKLHELAKHEDLDEDVCAKIAEAADCLYEACDMAGCGEDEKEEDEECWM